MQPRDAIKISPPNISLPQNLRAPLLVSLLEICTASRLAIFKSASAFVFSASSILRSNAVFTSASRSRIRLRKRFNPAIRSTGRVAICSSTSPKTDDVEHRRFIQLKLRAVGAQRAQNCFVGIHQDIVLTGRRVLRRNRGNDEQDNQGDSDEQACSCLHNLKGSFLALLAPPFQPRNRNLSTRLLQRFTGESRQRTLHFRAETISSETDERLEDAQGRHLCG